MTNFGRTIAAVVAGVCIVTSAACGGAATSPATPGSTEPPPTRPAVSTGPTDEVPSAPPTAAPSRPTPTPIKTGVGTIKDVILEAGFVDDDPAVLGNAVFAGSTVRTSDSGAVQFDITKQIRFCTMSQSSAVTVRPSADVLVDFLSGTTTCTTFKGPPQTLSALDTRILTPDPVLVVTVDGDNVQVGVASGIARVWNVKGGIDQPMYLGPKSVSFVPKDGPAGEPFGMDVGGYPDVVGKEVQRQLDASRPPKVGLPDVSGSPVLQHIAERKLLTVGYDARLEGDQQLTGFIGAIGQAQGAQWGIESNGGALSADEAPAALKDGTIQLFVSPDPIAGTPGPLPLVREPGADQPLWISIDQDEAFLNAERVYLQDLVNRGDYRVTFLKWFDQEPDYASIAGLYGLN